MWSFKFKTIILKIFKLVPLLVISFFIVSCSAGGGFGVLNSIFINYVWEDAGIIPSSEFSVLGLGADNTRYVAYRNRPSSTSSATDNKAAVSVFNGSSWVIYGSNGDNIGVNPTFLSLASDRSGNLFLAHNSGFNIVIQSNSSLSGTWTNIMNVVAKNVANVVIKTDKDDNKYLFYLHNGGTKEGVVLKSLAGNTVFSNLGATAFIDAYAGDFIIDSNNRPVVAYAVGNNLYVKAWNDPSWSLLGDAPVLTWADTSKELSEISLTSGNGKIYVAYKDPKFNNVVSVSVFNGSTWSGLPILNLADKSSLRINSKGIPILAVRDLSQVGAGIATVYTLEDNKWQILVREGIEDNISTSATKPISMEIDATGSPVVSFAKSTSFTATTSVLVLVDEM